tara:strand:- start:1336 stop:1587 length:252 start_codon:yes stop_codon:yes gene_type:complete
MFDDIEIEDLGVQPEFKSLVFSLCGLHNDPELLTTTDKFRISCVEALRLGYILSKYLGVDRQEFMDGLMAVMELEDNDDHWYN